jgi:AcrR family transcriptional regulator
VKKNPPSRAKFLQAGREVLLTSGRQILIGGLTAKLVYERAKISPNTFSKNWPSKAKQGAIGGHEKFIDDLLGSLVTDNHRVTHNLLAQEVLRVFNEHQGDPRLALRQLAEWNFQEVREDPSTLIRTFIATFARDHDVAMKSVRDEYNDLTTKAAAAYASTLTSWGGEFRRPFTNESIAVVLTALVEGMTLRWLLDPKTVPPGLFGDAVVALVGSVVDVEQRHQHIDDVMEPVTLEVMRNYKLGTEGKEPDDPREAIIEAAKEEFAQRSYYTTKLTHIAARAGLPQGGLKALFASKAEILDAGLEPIYETLKRRVSDDERLRRSPQELLTRHLERLAITVTENRAWFDALMMRAVYDLTQKSIDKASTETKILDFAGLLTPALEAGQNTGIFNDALSSYELATMLTNNVLMRALSQRELTGKEVVSSVCAAMLDGILARK